MKLWMRVKVMSTIPELSEIMRSAKDDDLGYSDDYDSPTEPMMPIIIAPHSPLPSSPDSSMPAGPTMPLQPASPIRSAPETPLVYPLLPPFAGEVSGNGRPPCGAAHTGNGLATRPVAPAQPGRSPVPIIVGYCFVFIQVVLLLRVLLLLFSVSNSVVWAKVLYTMGSVFAYPVRLPLDHIQPVTQLGPEVINYLAPLLAILIYGLVSRILVRFLKALLNSRV